MTESLILVGRRHVLVQWFFEFTSSLTTCLFSLQFQFIASKSRKDLAFFMLYLVAVPQSTEDRVPYLQGVSVPSSSPSLDKRRKDTTEASCQTVVLWKDGPIGELAFFGPEKFQENATKCNQKKNRTTSGTALSVQNLHYLQMHPHLRASLQALGPKSS